jgi:hypothetical protein
MRVTCIERPPATARSVCAVASPARIRSTRKSVVNPCASMIASVQPSGDAESNPSARRRSALRLLGRRRGLPTISLSGGRRKLCLRDDLGTEALGRWRAVISYFRIAKMRWLSPGPRTLCLIRRVGALMRSPALHDLCFEIVSERLETSVPLGCSFDRGQLEAPARPGLSLSLRLAKSTPLSLAPILLRLPCHRWCIRVFHLEPIGRSAGAIGRASASTRFPQGPSCRRAQTPLASCLISCSHASPDGGSGAFIGRHGGGKGTRLMPK